MIKQVSPSQVKVMLDHVSTLLTESGIHHVVRPAERVIEAHVAAMNDRSLLILYVPDQPLAVTFALMVSLDVSIETMRAKWSLVAEAISLANYTHPIGDLLVEPLTSQVFCRACIPLSDAVLTSQQFNETLQMTIGRAELMLPVFRAILRDGVAPHVAMRPFLSPSTACSEGAGNNGQHAPREFTTAPERRCKRAHGEPDDPDRHLPGVE